MKLKYLLLVFVGLPLIALAQVSEAPLNNADTERFYNNVSFSTAVEKEVERDLMTVNLYMQEEGADVKVLNKKGTERLNEAVALAKKQSAVEIVRNNQTTSPRYANNGKKNGWVARTQISLRSKDFSQLSQLVAELDEQFAIENVYFSLSDEKQKSLEDEMLQAALVKFTHQAELVKTGLNAKGYRIQNLRLNNADNGYQVYQDRAVYAAAPMMAKSFEKEALQLDNGKTKVQASVSADIQLINQ